jgi:hypothetical protein
MSIRVGHAAEVIDGASGAFRHQEANKQPMPAAAGLDDFERWLKVSTYTPPRRMEIPAGIELGGAARLAEMIEAVREALLACMAGLEDCNARTRRHWRQTEVSRQRERLDEPDREKIELWRETDSWGQKIRWLQELRIFLGEEQARCEEFPLDGSESGRART